MKKTLFLRDKPLLAIDISQTGVKMMSVNTKKMTVTSHGSIDLDPAKLTQSLDKSDPYLSGAIEKMLKQHVVGKINTDHAVISVPTSRTYSRSIVLPKEAEKNLFEAVKLEAEQYIPVPLNQLNLDYEVIERTDENIIVSISAAPSLLINSLTAACVENGLTVLVAEPGINSAARLINKTEEGHLPTVIVDIGAASTDIAILDGTIRATASVNHGGSTFTLAIANRMKVSLENAHQLKVLDGLSYGPSRAKLLTALKPSLSPIIDEVQKIIRYYGDRIEDNKKIEQVIIVGGGSNVPGLGEYFTEQLTLPARIASPWHMFNFAKLAHPNKQLRPRYITVAGLACIEPKDIWK